MKTRLPTIKVFHSILGFDFGILTSMLLNILNQLVWQFLLKDIQRTINTENII